MHEDHLSFLFLLVSSVKWDHLGHFDLEPNFPTNPMGSPGPLWARLYNNNYKNQNKNPIPLKLLLYLFSSHQLTIKVIIIMENRA